MRSVYYAKSKRPNGNQPTNKDHLKQVSMLAGQFGAPFGCAQEAELAGQFHDFGKYSDRFQGVLAGTDQCLLSPMMWTPQMLREQNA